MTSKEAMAILINAQLNYEPAKEEINNNYGEIIGQLFKDLEVLEILKRKGVAVGFIQLQIKENYGGVSEYNDYIGGDKSLHLTTDQYKKIKEWIENE